MAEEQDVREMLHGLGNALTRILTSADLLIETEGLPPSAGTDLQTIRSAALEGRDIVRDIAMSLRSE